MGNEQVLWQTLLEESVGHILAAEDYDALIEMLNTSPVLDPIFDGAPDGARAAFAHRFGREIWNATPLPGNRFRPRYRLPPKSGKPCPCCSGMKYKHCCEAGPRQPPLEPQLIWAIAWPMFNETEKKAALEAGTVPPEALPVIAQELLDADHPGKARDLLEPLFENPGKVREDVLLAGVELLSAAYRDLGHDNKRKAFLEHLADTSRGPLLAEVIGELCPVLGDEGNWDEAWRRHGQAVRAVPDEPMLAMLEISMLHAQGRAEEAGMRAKFWQRRLASRLDPDHPVREALDRIVARPEAGLLALGGDDLLMRVRDVVASGLERPEPAHLLVLEEALGDDVELESAIRQHFRGMGLSGEDLDRAVGQALEDLDEEAESTEDEPDDEGEAIESAVLKAPPAIAEIEERWREIYPASKPFSVAFEPFGESDPWDPDACAQWLEFLENNRSSFDSLDILDDLATALYIHPATAAGVLDEIYTGIVRRGVRLLDQTLLDHGEDVPQLPWPVVANRPALRLLAHHIHRLDECGPEDETLMRTEQYLMLSPGDNHGFRCQLMAHLLGHGDDESALELSERFPDDILIETSLGRVLALFRLGQIEEAAAALESVHGNNPHVLEMLTKDRVKKPKVRDRGIRPGGPDQAWLYREAMRPVWQKTPGAMEWLSERARSLKPGS